MRAAQGAQLAEWEIGIVIIRWNGAVEGVLLSGFVDVNGCGWNVGRFLVPI
ncbi:MAG: hypothetical protein LBG43_04155 [Treponema sp.]|nr:hypothetical protein [Treponema sp.]